MILESSLYNHQNHPIYIMHQSTHTQLIQLLELLIRINELTKYLKNGLVYTAFFITVRIGTFLLILETRFMQTNLHFLANLSLSLSLKINFSFCDLKALLVSLYIKGGCSIWLCLNKFKLNGLASSIDPAHSHKMSMPQLHSLLIYQN